MPITVTIIEDNIAFLQRFTASIEATGEFSIQGTAQTGAEGIAEIDRGRSDVYLVDLGLPDMSGIEVIRHATKVHPDCDVLVITVFGDDLHVIDSIEAGASGYILKDSSENDIADCIRTLRDGGSPVSPMIARKLLQKFQAAGSPAVKAEAEAIAAASTLTDREEQILRSLAKGMSNKEIGESHAISSHTVARHVKTIYRKLAVHSRGEAVYEASKLGLIRF
jgi:DNA-binding NarL/FixJ family response regulator